jgi:hypothetical protein
MKRNGEGHYRLALVVVALVILVPLLQWVRAQGRKAPIHMTTDWSNRHMIFSTPSSLPQSWRLNNEPRFNHQWLRRNPGALQPSGQNPQFDSPANRNAFDQPQGGQVRNDVGDRPIGPFRPNKKRTPGTDVEPLRADWGVSMQAAGTTGVEMFPAKFSFDISAAPDCTNDYIVYNSGLVAAAPVHAARVGTFAGSSTNGNTVTITNGAVSLVLFNNTGATPSTAQATLTFNTPINDDTVTVGAITYRLRTIANGLALANDVLIGTTNTATAQNLRAIIDDAIGECSTATCFNVALTTTPNSAVAHPVGNAAAVDTLTSPVDGAAGNFTLTTNSTGTRFLIGGAPGANGGQGASDGPNFLGATGSTTTDAVNLAAAINRVGNGDSVGVSVPVVPTTASLTLQATGAGTDGNLITLAETMTNFSWAGGAIRLAGGTGQASIFALNNLYSTQGSAGGFCNTNGPSVMWSYRTSTLVTPGASVTSPVISGDGTKVAYVETSASGAMLHILKWKAGEGVGVGDAPVPTTTLSAGQTWAANCPAGNSCIMNTQFNGGATDQDTNSSPFYNYNTDSLYVGDNVGKLHKFTNVFLGAPAEVTTGGWPFTVHAAAILSSPVMDNGSHNIFVGDNTGVLSYVKEVGSVTGTCSGGGNATPCLGLVLGATSGAVTSINISTGATSTSNGGAALGGAVTDAPIVDGSIGVLFVTNGTETGANHGTMIETNTALGSSVVGQVIANQRVGGNSGPPNASPIHTGTFDNAYLNSAGGTGSFYVCGAEQITGHNSRPAIYKFALTNGVMTVVPSGTTTNELLGLASNSSDECSSVTEVENPNAAGGAKEWLFFSFANNANNGVANGGTGLPNAIPAGSPCNADQRGCIVSIDITSGTWPPTLVTSAVSLPAGAVVGGINISATSGIIVDNVASPGSAAQASSIYFTLGGNSASGTGNPGLPQCDGHNGVGCAVKLTQAALQ